MGMDQYLEVEEGGERHVIASWRKDYDLHLAFKQEWYKENPEKRQREIETFFLFNLKDFELTEEMLVRIEEKLRHPLADIAFLEKAKAALRRGARVIYSASY